MSKREFKSEPLKLPKHIEKVHFNCHYLIFDIGWLPTRPKYIKRSSKNTNKNEILFNIFVF